MLLLSPIALGGLIWFALSEQPAINTDVNLSHRDIERAKAIIKQHDPRRAAPGSARSIAISEQDLSLAANYLLQRFLRGSANIVIRDGAMELLGTVHLPILPARPYVNVRLELESTGAAPRIGALQIGAIPVPNFITAWLLERIAAQFYGTEEYALASAIIQRFEPRAGVLQLSYRWDPQALRSLGTRLAGSDTATLAAYHDHLLSLQKQGIALQGSAVGALRAMFKFAQQRSASGDPVAENRALLLILGAWASDQGTRTILPQARREPHGFALTLQQRRDFAQHFLVSAGVAAGSDTKLSDAIGVFKEVSDSRGGSGFSFTDIAADRAGTRFGELATASRDDALRVQRFVQNKLAEADVMPLARDLPEGLTEAEFKRRYTEVGSWQYQAVVEAIERRVAACRLYRD
jgi:hypothetical protein